jgi:hypothetical protein
MLEDLSKVGQGKSYRHDGRMEWAFESGTKSSAGKKE